MPDDEPVDGVQLVRKPAQLRRFENKAQLIRHIAETESVDINDLWDQYDRQVDTESAGCDDA